MSPELAELLARDDIPADARGVIRDAIAQWEAVTRAAGAGFPGAAERAQALLSSTINSLGDGLHVVDTDLRIVMFSDVLLRWCEDMGYRITHPLGRVLSHAFPFLPESVLDEYRQVIRSRQMVVSEEVTELAGRQIVTETRKIPVIEQGEVRQVVTVLRDLTGQRRSERRLRESERLYRTLIEATADGILIADATTRQFCFANSAICRILGYSRAELLGLGVDDIHPPEEMGRVLSVFQAMARGRLEQVFDLPTLRRDGTVFRADINAGFVTVEGRECLLGAFRDATERELPEATEPEAQSAHLGGS